MPGRAARVARARRAATSPPSLPFPAGSRFAEMMGRDFQQLDLYFSSVLVYQLPNSKTAAVRDSDGAVLNGRLAFADQIRKLREVLRAVLNTRKLERALAVFDGTGVPYSELLARQAARLEGVEIARDMVRRVQPMVDGVQLSAPFGRYQMAVDVAEVIERRD